MRVFGRTGIQLSVLGSAVVRSTNRPFANGASFSFVLRRRRATIPQTLVPLEPSFCLLSGLF